MDSKEPLLDTLSEQEAAHAKDLPSERTRHLRSKRAVLNEYSRRILPASILVLILWSLFRASFVQHHHWCPGKNLKSQEELVPLEAHIMSKCPDAAACLKDLVVPAMVKVSDKVNFTLSYIGRYISSHAFMACVRILTHSQYRPSKRRSLLHAWTL